MKKVPKKVYETAQAILAAIVIALILFTLSLENTDEQLGMLLPIGFLAIAAYSMDESFEKNVEKQKG